MSVYRNDKPEFVVRAVDSITTMQTLQPNEIVLVVDGPIPDSLDKLIKSYEQSILFNVIRLSENKGLGTALRIGVKSAKHEIIARMDSDDIAISNRFEKQVFFLRQNPNIDVIGGQIEEFIESVENKVGKRLVPLEHHNLITYARVRCPFNHMTVMFRKNAVINAGNYLPWHFNEDYYLWVRMIESNATFANLSDILVNVRVGKDMYTRRGGWRYFTSEKKLQDYMFCHNIISPPRYCYNVFGRFVMQVAIPNRLRGFIYQKFFRK